MFPMNAMDLKLNNSVIFLVNRFIVINRVISRHRVNN